MKLKLKDDAKSAVEIGIGNFSQKFEPGVAVEVERSELANYILQQGPFEVVEETQAEESEQSNEQSDDEAPRKRTRK